MVQFQVREEKTIDTQVAKNFGALRKRACKTPMHMSQLRSARKFRMKERRLNSWSKFWLVACRLCTDGHIASLAMQLTQRTRFRMLFSPPIPTCTSSEGRHRSLLGLRPSCLTALDCSYAGG